MSPQPTAADVARDRLLRQRLGYGVLDIESESGVGFEDVHRYSHMASPGLSPRATTALLRRLLDRPMSETEAKATLAEIREYGRGRGESGEDLPLERAAREWDECCGYAFRRSWYLREPHVGERRYLPGGRELGPGILDKLVGAVLPGLRPLMEGGFSMASVLTHATWELLLYASEALRGVPVPERSARYHARLVGALTGWQVSATEAQVVGKGVLEHQAHLGQRAGRHVSVGHAAIDYFKRLGFSGLGRSSLWEKGWSWESEYGKIPDSPAACIPCPA